MSTRVNSARALLGATLLLAGCRAQTLTRLELAGQENPPTFKLSGNSYSLTFTVRGPFPNLQELQNDTGQHVAIWEINTSTTADSHTPIEDLPRIIYGQAPRQFAQFFPHDNQKPVSLEQSKFYKAVASATHANSDRRGGWIWEHSELCFTLITNRVEKVPCVQAGTGGYGLGN